MVVAVAFENTALVAKRFVAVLFTNVELVPDKLPTKRFVAVAFVAIRLVVEALREVTVPVAVMLPTVALYE